MHTLEQTVATGNVILVVGTGFSAATTGGAKTAMWAGLIRDGIEHVCRLRSDPTDRWRGLAENLLSYGIEDGDSDSMIQAASMVKKELRALGEQAYADWLAQSVGNLPIVDESLAKAINTLPFPVLTTNYDTLLERITGRRSAHWAEPGKMQTLLGGFTNDIGHLHGVWDAPDTPVFSTEDYSTVINADPAQHLQQAASSIKSLVYIGFGSGLDDPNFGQLLRWHRETFTVSGLHHYRLCRESEVAELVQVHAGDNIVTVPYGNEYEELPDFLTALADLAPTGERSSAGIVRDVVDEARTALLDTMQADLILGELPSDDPPSIESLVLPPVFLPVPHAEYVKERRTGDKKSDKIEKIDPLTELNQTEFLVLVAESETGLTTALRWLAWKSSIDLVTAAPIVVSFRECRGGRKPLENRIAAAAREAGIVGSNGTMSEYILAIDDVNPGVPAVFERVMSALCECKQIGTIIGCRQGDEDAIVERLRRSGHEPRLRYLSKLGDKEVAQLVARAHPVGAERLTSDVLGVLQGENLPRTPFSVSLLIAVLVRGGMIGSSASQTAILEQYVAMLLGRGDPHEDSRFTVDQPGREALLSAYAEHLARTESAGMAEAAAVTKFSETMEAFDWSDSPIGIINHLVGLRVLRRTATGQIEFARSSFLFLFAAKQAATSPEFRAFLLEQPLYYAPVLQDYSALVRSDASVVRAVLDTLPSSEELATSRTPYEVLDQIEAPPAKTQDADAETEDEPVEDPYDSEFELTEHDDSDSLPFPVDGVQNLSPVRRLMRSLDLASTVLRDSDQVQDIELKDEAFALVLQRWGQLISVMHEDAQFNDFISELARSLHDVRELQETQPELLQEILNELSKIVPAALAGGGIESTLASRKLLRVFNRGIDRQSFLVDDETKIAACLFAFSLREPGWPGAIRKLLHAGGNLWLSRNFVYRLLREAHRTSPDSMSKDDREDLMEVCVEIFDRATKYDNDAARWRRLDQLRSDMRQQRQLALARTILAGRTATARHEEPAQLGS
ncbi:SIR2 family protein [Cellulosimicrobium sp. AB352]|uniref:SIR2 family protein n=1 Tax=Cellulosimicrobium sp. AB352 TaxID=3413281 RepID=UPI003C1A5D82